ncbi:MAG: hypothetical protein IJ744_03555 [Lachnospiraceae bacterium]|nr:hypothetical protein [Lachnospiraceae bacterium]
MKRARYVSLFALFLLFTLLFAGCAKTQENEAETSEVSDEMDASGNYHLSASGEAIIDDASTRTPVASQDNARVFYEIFVGSFSDSNGDGIGDLRGIINRMDYLNDGDPASGQSLGIEGIWLTPIFKSPSYHKYDITDYYEVDPDFGTMDDLKELVDLCHERGVKVILDLPINHTGRLNEWFARFCNAHRTGDTTNEYYDFYSWFGPGESSGGLTTQQINGSSDYYECNFSGDMPELNFDNPAVRQAVLDVAAYYLDLGVDGFRFDAAKYIYFGDDQTSENFWFWYIHRLRNLKSDIYTVAEVWSSDGVTDIYYPAMNCFNFTTSQTTGLIAETAKKGNVNAFTSYVGNFISHVQKMNTKAMYVPFIANHDTDRAAGYLTVASNQMQMAANLYILCPGSPFIYYGEEIGMKGSRGSANTDANRRLAMVWGDDDTIADPEGTTYDPTKKVDASVADQLADGDSLLSYYKKLIMIRKANPEIARGDYAALPFENTKIGGFTSTQDGSTVAVIHNTTGSEVTVDLADVTDLSFTEITAVIGLEDASLEGTKLTIGSSTSVVLR